MNTVVDTTYKHVLDNIHDGLYITDRSKHIIYWNTGAERITGYTAEEVIGSRCSDNILMHVDDEGNKLCLGGCPLEATIQDTKPRIADVYLHHKDGYRVPIQVRTSVIKDTNGVVIQGIELFTDKSNEQAANLKIAELERLAMLDNLTNLANRNYIEKEISLIMKEFEQFQMPCGLLFFDIDHFKQVNDVHGHLAGDEILKMIAGNIKKNARPFDLFGRWGGEEFIGIIRNIEPSSLAVIGERLRVLVEHSSIDYEGKQLQVTVSIGATMIQNGDTKTSLLERVDSLMYESKKNGRNCLTSDQN